MATRNPIIPYSIMLTWMKEILSEYSDPITVRQLYYQLVSRQKIENRQSYYQKVSRDATTARENGDISPDAIEDRGRTASDGDEQSDETADGFIAWRKKSLENCWRYYQYPKWMNQPVYCEVWCEKQALQRIIADIASKYNVISCVAKGFSSFTFANDAASRFFNQQESGKICKILYFGDFDPSGEDMVRDLHERICRYGADKVTIEKIALTKEQVTKYNLPYDPAKRSDPRAAKFIEKNGDICVELDALPPNTLRSFIDTAINTCINPDIWQQNIDAHEAQRKIIRSWCESREA